MSNLLEVKQLSKVFPIRRGFFGRHAGDVRAVDGVSFSIGQGETLGLVGESGCGKTTTGRLILRAIDPSAGQILFNDGDSVVDLAPLSRRAVRPIRRHIQMVFQDPYASLNPRMTIQEIISEPLLCMNVGGMRQRRDRVAELLEVVGLDPQLMTRYPHAFSGGQRQRIGIARALALNPKLIVCDEAVSALDVSVQAQVLNLLRELQDEFKLTYLFITHDLSVVEHLCTSVAVMYVGKLVELGDTDELFYEPKHPYVETLLAAVPRPRVGDSLARRVVRGEVADPANRPKGCAFHPRCPYAEERCRIEEPPLVNIASPDSSPRWVACHFAKELTLQGVGNVA